MVPVIVGVAEKNVKSMWKWNS